MKSRIKYFIPAVLLLLTCLWATPAKSQKMCASQGYITSGGTFVCGTGGTINCAYPCREE